MNNLWETLHFNGEMKTELINFCFLIFYYIYNNPENQRAFKG